MDQLLEKVKSGIAQLPGVEAHHKMSMVRFKQEPQHVLDNARKSAVMLLLYPKNDQWYSVLIQRPTYDGVHSGQIALPGGQMENEDLDLEATAIRETLEEVGVDGMQVLGKLTQVYIKPSNFIVHPFVGWLESEPQFDLQEEEVAEVVTFPVEILLDDSIVYKATVPTKNYGELKVPAFDIKDKVVWGATAAILSEFKEILKG